MAQNKITLAIIALTVIGLAGGFGAYQWMKPPGGQPQATANTPENRPAFSLPDLAGEQHDISEWDGEVLLVNFWATWCPPCRKEIPAFMDLQDAYGPKGFHVIGVAIDEKDKVQDYADTLGINYPVLVGELDAINIAKAYGNRLGTLPYTVVLDRSGRIVQTHRQGELSYEAAERLITPYL